MNIGITTFQWADNYGAVLQAHALQSFLQSRGHKVQIVDYRPQTPKPLVRRWLSSSPRGCIRKWEAEWKKYLFEQFRKKYLTRTSCVFRSSSELLKIADSFDLLIAGSDQVWNPKWLDQFEGLFDFYFLSFARSKTRRISYAASIGHSDSSTLRSEWQKILADKMKVMDAISVREQSGVELVRQLCGRTDAVFVADPTLLLDRAHYERLVGPPVRHHPYLFSFMLHGLERDAAPACRTISTQLDLKIVRCDAVKSGLHADYTLPSPEGWLRQIRDARFVVTNSFHCILFCLIFHIPFAAVLIEGEIGSMNSRIIDLLKAVELPNRIVAANDEIFSGSATERIKWDQVDRAVGSMKDRSIAFLEKHIES